MTAEYDPFDADRPLTLRCTCGRSHSVAEHIQAFGVAHGGPRRLAHNAGMNTEEQRAADFMEAALVKALFPREPVRRAFLKAVGRPSAMAAIASLFPMGAMQALAQDRKPLEKTDLKIGFLPITCATPLVAADPLGFYAKEGLKVKLNRTAGWAVVRDKTLAAEFDASLAVMDAMQHRVSAHRDP